MLSASDGSRNGFIGGPPPSPFRGVEGSNIYGSLSSLSDRMDTQKDFDDRQRTLNGIGNNIDAMASRQLWSEMKYSKLEVDLKNNVEKQNTAIKSIKSTTELQSEAIRDLFLHLRLLESSALTRRANPAALFIHRQLDNARFCIADGILTAFPGLYVREIIMSQHDPLGKAVYWNSFIKAISCHFWRLHDLVTLVDRSMRTRAFELKQRESVFADCYARRLYMIGPLAQDRIAPHEQRLAAVSPGKFGTRVVRTFPVFTEKNEHTEVGMVYGPYDEKVLRHVFDFFVPALAWAYTELKKHIIRGDSIIRALEKSNANQRYLVDHPLELVPAEVPKSFDGEMNSRFAHGTALDVRKEENWKAYTDQLGAASVDQGKKLYNCWLEQEDVYEAIEREETTRAEAEKKTLEDAFPCTQSALAFIPPANGMEHTSTTRLITTIAGHKRSSSDVDGAQFVDSPNKARKASESSSPPFRASDNADKEVALNVFNAERALSEDEEKLKMARKRRRVHVARFTSIHKCLSILLDPDLVDFSILGESLIHEIVHHHHHTNVFDNDAELDPLERVLELVRDCPRSTCGAMSGKSYNVQIAKLRDLLGKDDEDMLGFDDPEVTLPMEVALDKYLSDKARMSFGSKNLEDIHLIMSYLDDIKPSN